MSRLLLKILWYKSSDLNTAINITDLADLSTTRGLDIKNNILTFRLKNATLYEDINGNKVSAYIDTNNQIMFEEQDQIKIYIKYTDDFADIESSVWSNENAELPPSTNLRGTYYVIEFDVVHNIKSTPVQVKCADKTYILFNRLLAKGFAKGESLTAPEIIQKIIRYSSQQSKGIKSGSGSDPNVNYDIDARLDSERTAQEISDGVTLIQDTRRATKENGDVNPDTNFPIVSITKVWKPIYEWLEELSQLEYINTADEFDTYPVYGRPFLYYVDEENIFHWFENDNTVDTEIVIGTDTGIFDYKLTKKVFDVCNFIVYRGGEDFYGKGTLDYYIDPSTNVKTKRMRVVAMTDVAKTLIDKEIKIGNLVSATDGEFTYSGNRYNRNGTVTPDWSATSYSSDSDYNTALRDRILDVCENRARALVYGLSHARYTGTMTRKGQFVTPGTLYKITNRYTGQVFENIRVLDITENITKSVWNTIISLEQDNKAIIQNISS